MRGKKSKRNKTIWKKSNGVCAHCGNKLYGGRNQTIDHVLPRSRGGGFDQRNLMPLCRKCNKLKMSELIDIKEYYKYATDEAINDAIDYLEERSKELRELKVDITKEE